MAERPTRCAGCGLDPALGWAEIDGVRFCHEGPSPTCYETAQGFPDLFRRTVLERPDGAGGFMEEKNW